MFEPLSAVQHCLDAGGQDGAAPARAVRIAEVRGWYLTQLAAFRGREAQLQQLLRERLALPGLPDASVAVRNANSVVFNTAPGQYWVVTNDRELDAAWPGVVGIEDGTATALSQARVRVAISGAGARAVLEQHLTVDLHPTRMVVGGYAQSALHHTGVLVHRSADSVYELYLLRTFAQTLWECLADAALVQGYDVGVDQVPATLKINQ